MEAVTFPDPALQTFLNARFVPVLLDVSTEAAERLGVSGIPATRVIGSDGGALASQDGYLDAAGFLEWMETASGDGR